MAELKVSPVNRVRFAFWGAEEEGLIGSQAYVDSLAKSDLKNIMLNLNFDMVGSPNFVRFVYDGDGSAFGADGPNGSGTIEDVFTDYFSSLADTRVTAPTEFDGRSDYQAFINAGIPAGGLFTGAEGIKTADGGGHLRRHRRCRSTTLCYHQSCDTFVNLSETASIRCRTRPHTRRSSTSSHDASSSRERHRQRVERRARTTCSSRLVRRGVNAHRQVPGRLGLGHCVDSGLTNRSGIPVCSAIIDRYPDYDLDDVLVVEDPKQLRALGDASRARIVMHAARAGSEHERARRGPASPRRGPSGTT